MKAKRYRKLFETNSKDLALMGINEVMVTCFRNQYKQRHLTLKKALKEVEDTYGICVTKLSESNVRRMSEVRQIRKISLLKDRGAGSPCNDN